MPADLTLPPPPVLPHLPAVHSTLSHTTVYRWTKVGEKGHRVFAMLLPEGRGFTWEVADAKERLIRRDYCIYETPGAAETAGTKWVETNEVNL